MNVHSIIMADRAKAGEAARGINEQVLANELKVGLLPPGACALSLCQGGVLGIPGSSCS